MTSTHDTLVALATPPGTSALAIIRLSGSQAFNIAQRIFSGSRAIAGNRSGRYVGRIAGFDPLSQKHYAVDQVVVHTYKAPHSFTGEDMVEVNCHGSCFIIEEIIRLCLEQGARPAEPGGFSKRAFLNGKMDLLQAEAVADLIQAQTQAALQQAIGLLDGTLSQKLSAMKERIRRLCALLELELDFSEDMEFVDRASLQAEMSALDQEMTMLLRSFTGGQVIRDGAHVVIAGKPNVGKSSLLNRLLQRERAIVTSQPGTTRDSIEETLRLEGCLFRISDTAGIRETQNEVELQGVMRTLALVEKADILLVLLDAGKALVPEDVALIARLMQPAEKEILIVLNKADLPLRLDVAALKDAIAGRTVVNISCKEGTGLDILQQWLVRCVRKRTPEEPGVLTRVRHHALIQRAQEHLGLAAQSMQRQLSAEFIAFDIRQALACLGEIVGEVSSEDILNDIFTKFCIGK